MDDTERKELRAIIRLASARLAASRAGTKIEWTADANNAWVDQLRRAMNRQGIQKNG